MRSACAALCGIVVAASLAGTPARARDLLFWNMTEHEFVGVYLAPPGTNRWSTNMALSDNIDYTANDDERIRMPGVVPGQYDMKLVDKQGQTCIVRNVAVNGTRKVAVGIDESQLTNCTQAR
jgi:hypothetical protein